MFVLKRFILILTVCAIILSCLCLLVFCTSNKKAKDDPVELSLTDDKEIIYTLSRNLPREEGLINPGDWSHSRKINFVKSGLMKAAYVAVDPDECYYICGYYIPEHKNEMRDFCCAAKYTWVKFYNNEDIAEYYGEKMFIGGFQINKAHVVDITSVFSKTPQYEHFLVYTPEFQNGVNVADKLYCDISYIDYFSSDKEYILYSSEERFHEKWTMACLIFEEQYYIEECTDKVYLESMYGEYYEDVAKIIIADKYSKENYGLININEFVEKILK